MASIVAVTNETRSSGSRVTREGKKITYQLHVIQEPERARACGSGAKSSADRRPVDPPPIVALRVFEGEGPSMTDVTFSYKANFFLFATLENARTIAQGRMPPASFPVLTGTPVAGMAYLDRPEPAGYFIFPDLSVRHEGKYRLSFALYEELKDDADMDPEGNNAVQVQTTGIDAFVSHRLEVKSTPFTVFSAKKFPGLAESTALSRTVAEQGCRVRIRRDVRMRRREDNKGSKDWDSYEDDTADFRARRTATPTDAYGQGAVPTPQTGMDSDRPRSASNASHHSFPGQQRRPSMSDAAQNYQAPYPQQIAPQPQQEAYQSYSNTQHPYQSGYNGQQQQPAMMQPPQTPYQHSAPQQPYQQSSAQSQPPAQPSIQPMPPTYGYMPSQAYSPPTYEQNGHVRADSMEYPTPGSYRRAGMPSSTSSGSSYGLEAPSRAPPAVPQMPHAQHATSGAPSLAPLRTLELPAQRLEPVSPAYQTQGPMSAGNDTLSFNGATPQAGAKRAYGDTFDTRHMNQPLRQGARPSAAPFVENYANGFDNDDDNDGIDHRAMRYRRADGSERSRRIPIVAE